MFLFPSTFKMRLCFCVTQASDLDGEIDLSTCYNVTEYQAQRNYGFQIHVSGFACFVSNLSAQGKIFQCDDIVTVRVFDSRFCCT